MSLSWQLLRAMGPAKRGSRTLIREVLQSHIILKTKFQKTCHPSGNWLNAMFLCGLTASSVQLWDLQGQSPSPYTRGPLALKAGSRFMRLYHRDREQRGVVETTERREFLGSRAPSPGTSQHQLQRGQDSFPWMRGGLWGSRWRFFVVGC